MSLLCSCSGNDIYFDFKTQNIKSTDGENIHRLIIKKEHATSYVTVVKNMNERGADSINLFVPNGNYHIEIEIPFMSLKQSLPITLSPNSTYIITNSSYGDAAPCSIKICTDSAGMFIEKGYECPYHRDDFSE